MLQNAVTFQETFSVVNRQVDRRLWRDCHLNGAGTACSGLDPFGTNGDDFVQDWEIGPPNIRNFGLVSPDRPDPDIERPYALNYHAGIEHELQPGLSVGAGWYRRSMHKLFVRARVLTGPGSRLPTPARRRAPPARPVTSKCPSRCPSTISIRRSGGWSTGW